MNETEIRARVRDAIGVANYPPSMPVRLKARLEERAPSGHPMAIGLVAAVLALAIIATLLFVRLQGAPAPVPATTPSPQGSIVFPDAQLPAADLEDAQLVGAAADLVTPLNLVAESNGRTVTLIGAYADTAKTVLFFRSMPAAGFPYASIVDDQGFLNASSTNAGGSLGDSAFILAAGPHAGSDGMAHLQVTVDNFVDPRSNNMYSPGSWTFSFALKVQTATALSISPSLSSLGKWTVTVEALEVTPAVVHFQAAINGATVDDVAASSITLVDPTGRPVPSSGTSASTTVPKSQLGSSPPRSTRVYTTWPRPALAGTYALQIAGGGAEFRGNMTIAAPPPGTQRKGKPLLPTDFPGSSEAIDLQGAFTASVLSGNPSQCGFGSGPSGSIFAFATWFQVDGSWYVMVFSTDPAIRQYKGPGAYTARAIIYPYAPYGANPIFAGTVQLTVTSDKKPDNGSVRGTLAWTGPGTQKFDVSVGGTWSCTPGPALGPG